MVVVAVVSLKLDDPLWSTVCKVYNFVIGCYSRKNIYIKIIK